MKRLFMIIALAAIIPLNACSEKEDVVTIHTDLGDIVLILFNETPLHKENFLELVKGKFYDGTTFHRIIDGFMIQGGDPNSKDDDPANDGTGGPGFTVPAEINAKLTHVRGALAAARQPDFVNPEKASNGSQFYIVENEDGYHPLDGNYTVFGQAISGLDVVSKIAEQPKGAGDRPLTDIKMTMEVTSMSRNKITKLYGYKFK